MKNIIKARRKALGISQAQLAERIGVNTSAVGMWELGERKPRHEKIPKLAEALGCTIGNLYGEVRIRRRKGRAD